MKPINASEEELMSNCDVQSANTEAGFAAVLAQQFTNLSMFNVERHMFRIEQADVLKVCSLFTVQQHNVIIVRSVLCSMHGLSWAHVCEEHQKGCQLCC